MKLETILDGGKNIKYVVNEVPGNIGGGHEGVGTHRTLGRVVKLRSLLLQGRHLIGATIADVKCVQDQCTLPFQTLSTNLSSPEQSDESTEFTAADTFNSV